MLWVTLNEDITVSTLTINYDGIMKDTPKSSKFLGF